MRTFRPNPFYASPKGKYMGSSASYMEHEGFHVATDWRLSTPYAADKARDFNGNPCICVFPKWKSSLLEWWRSESSEIRALVNDDFLNIPPPKPKLINDAWWTVSGDVSGDLARHPSLMNLRDSTEASNEAYIRLVDKIMDDATVTHFKVNNFPVILTIDTRNLEVWPDIDTLRAARHCALYRDIYSLGLDRAANLDPEQRDRTRNAIAHARKNIWSASLPPTDEELIRVRLLGALHKRVEHTIWGQTYRLGRIIDKFRAWREGENSYWGPDLLPEERRLLVDLFGQGRYFHDIDDWRLVSVHCFDPRHIYPPSLEKYEEQGIDYLVKWVKRGQNQKFWARHPELFTEIYRRPDRPDPDRDDFNVLELDEPDQFEEIAFHGTSLANLLLAMPQLVSELPEEYKARELLAAARTAQKILSKTDEVEAQLKFEL